jgi:hypothetical protein
MGSAQGLVTDTHKQYVYVSSYKEYFSTEHKMIIYYGRLVRYYCPKYFVFQSHIKKP